MLHMVTTLATMVLVLAMGGIIVLSLRDGLDAIVAALRGDVQTAPADAVRRTARVRWTAVTARPGQAVRNRRAA